MRASGSWFCVAMAGDANRAARWSNLEVHHQRFRSQLRNDSEENLITLCKICHGGKHAGNDLEH